jgi:hypothetical protein
MARTKKTPLQRKIGKLIFEATELNEGQADALAANIIQLVAGELRITRATDGFPERMRLAPPNKVACEAQWVLTDNALVIGLSGPLGATFGECRIEVTDKSAVVGALRRTDRSDIATLTLRSSS